MFFDNRRFSDRLRPGWMSFDPQTDATAAQIFKHCFDPGHQAKYRRDQFVPLMKQLYVLRNLPEPPR